MAKYKSQKYHYKDTTYYEYPGYVGVAYSSYHPDFKSASRAASNTKYRLDNYNDGRWLPAFN